MSTRQTQRSCWHKPGRKSGVIHFRFFCPVRFSNQGDGGLNPKEGIMYARQNRHVHFIVGLAFVALAFIGLALALSSVSVAQAQGCSISKFEMQPQSVRYPFRSEVKLVGESNCGTVKFHIDNLDTGLSTDKAEIGLGYQTETWKTWETGSGRIRVFFLARGDGGWENAAVRSFDVTVDAESGGSIETPVPPVNPPPSSGAPFIDLMVQMQNSLDYYYIRVNINFDITSRDPVSRYWITIDGKEVERNDDSQSPTPKIDIDATNYSGEVQVCVFAQARSDQQGQRIAQQCQKLQIVKDINPPPPSGTCATYPTLVKAGDIAVINTITPDPARARHQASKSSDTKFMIPVRSQVSIISGPVCAEGWTWFEVGYNGQSGWAPHATETGYEYVPNGYELPYYPGGKPSVPNCGSAPTPRLSAGMQAKVTDTPEWVMTQASFLSPSRKVGEYRDYGTVISILSGPVCGTGKNGPMYFYEVEGQGLRGYAGEGYSDKYWLEPVSTVQPTNNIQKVPILIAADWSFTFQFDTQRCWVINGSDFVVWEINRVGPIFQSDPTKILLFKAQVPLSFIRYSAPKVGESDKTRETIERELSQHATAADKCAGRILYKIGDRVVDTSAPGQFVYGYFLDEFGLPFMVQELIAKADQLGSSEIDALKRNGIDIIAFARDFTLKDNEDDRLQREVGQALRASGLSVDNLNSIANTVSLH
jgi:hypothetical protein